MASRRYNPQVAGIQSAFSGPYSIQGKIPMLFQVLSLDMETPLLPEAMYLHVNPSSLSLNYAKVINRIQTRGGFHEQHWGNQLTEISANNTSGAFINIEQGVTVAKRRDSIANYKFYNLIELFHNNGEIHNDQGSVVYRGRIRITYNGGIYDGYFTSFNVEETAESPFQFTASWNFKVESEAQNLLV